MSDCLRFHKEVAADLRQAIDIYDGIRPALGDRFRAAVNAGFDVIESNPELFPIVFDDVRFVRLRRFPYLVLYRVQRKIVWVLGVFHGASHPDRWRGRT